MAVTLTQRNLGAAPTEIRLAYVELVRTAWHRAPLGARTARKERGAE